MCCLKGWNHRKFGAINKELNKLRERLGNLEAMGAWADHSKLMKVRQRMDELFESEELMWLQRSRVAWLKEGDRNTKYFHRKVAHRAKKNRIKLLRKEDG
jgi:hypothetical protein